MILRRFSEGLDEFGLRLVMMWCLIGCEEVKREYQSESLMVMVMVMVIESCRWVCDLTY